MTGRYNERSPIVTNLKAGNVGSENFTEIEADGTMVAKGDATVWDDLVGSLVGKQLASTAGKLDYNYSNSSITMAPGGSTEVENDRLIFNFQYPHGAIEGGSMRLHIHWEQTSTDTIEWTTQYRIQNNGSPKTEDWTTCVSNSTDNSVFTYTSGILNQITLLCAVPMADMELSSTVQFRLIRTDNTASDIEATFVDAHVERDMFGSREEYVK